MKKIILILFCLVNLTACAPLDTQEPASDPTAQEEAAELTNDQINQLSDYTIEPWVRGLEVPWGMVFSDENRMLITERPGRVREVVNGTLNSKPLHVFEEVSSTGEEGLMSVEVDPNYSENKWLYFSLAYPKDDELKLKVVRFTDQGDRLEDETVILDDLPAARFHAGSRIAFGPDGKLYITVGDALNKKDAQDLNSMAGKLLRVDKDGGIPSDNPWPESPIWSYGHRNSQGIDWDPETGELFSTEHGPSVFDGPAGGDELNRIIKGGNYGWPAISHNAIKKDMISPLISFTPAEPPGSLLVYSGKAIPQFKQHLFFGSLGGEGLMHVELERDPNDKGLIRVKEAKKMEEVDVGRIRNVIEGPDGSIYFSTSNRDGRGNPDEADDRIFVIKAE